MRTNLFIVILLAWAAAGCRSPVPPHAEPEVKVEPYSCPFVSTPVTLDGELNEPAWNAAQVINFVLPESLGRPISRTEARMVYDKDFLYVAFKAYDQDVWGVFAARDSSTCREDVLEVFFKTNPDKDPYFDFEINALGTVFDAYVVKRNAGDHRWLRWNCAGLKKAINIKGTLNAWMDKDEYWIMEVAIPFAELPTLAGKSPGKGDEWLFSLARYDYSIYLPEGRERSSSSLLLTDSFHAYQHWRKLVFN